MALAVSQSIEFVEGKAYDAPAGWHWATRAEVEAVPGWSRQYGAYNYRGLGGWTEYVWEGVERRGFRFRLDSGGRAVDVTACIHAGGYEGTVVRGATHRHMPQGYAEFAGIVCIQD